MDLMCNFLPGDPRLVEQIVKELKSQGIFDQFRKECISDVDTKPAYQNLRQRVEGSVFSFLKEQKWNPDMNKNQVREMLRKHIHETGFLETGVERIVDQVVNPKINSVFLPKVDDVMYKYLGIERPKEVISLSTEKSTLNDLLPKDLEAVSPEVPEDKDTELPKEEIKNEIIEAPPNSEHNDEKIMQEENSIDSQSSALSGIVSHDSNNSLKQDSVISQNSSESRMSPSESTLRIELDDTSLSHKSSDSNSKSERLSEEKVSMFNNIENKDKEETISPTEGNSEKYSEESKSKPRDKKKEKHHSSSDRSKSRSDREKDKSRSEKHKKDEKDEKTEEKRYKIPKISDKNKDYKSKDKDDKHRSDKGKSEKDSRSDKDKKYDKDKKSKYTSEKENLNNDKIKRDDKNEKKEKDDKREKKETSKSEKNKDDKRSSSSKKRESTSSKNYHKDKERNTKIHKEETTDKNIHCSSSSKKDSKSRKDDDKSKSSHKKSDKSDKEDRKRKRRSKDDHYSSKEKRSGGRSSDRDSDGPSSSKKLHSSPQTTSGNSVTQQKTQESSSLNSEGSSGYSGNSDKTEERNEDVGNNALIEMQKIKVPKFASNLNEAMKIMKIRKLLKKLDGIIKTNPSNPEVQHFMKEIEELTRDVKREKQEQKENTEEIDEIDNIQKTENSATASINIDEFISSSNISMAKWNALEAKFMEQISDVDYNSYESPYMDDEETSVIKPTIVTANDRVQENLSSNESDKSGDFTSSNKFEDTITQIEAEKNSPKEFRKTDSCEGSPTVDKDSEKVKQEEIVEETDELNTSHPSHVIEHVLEQTTASESMNFQELNVDIPESAEVDVQIQVDLKTGNFKDFKQRAIVLLHKHDLTEEMIKIQNKDSLVEGEMDTILKKTDESLNIFEIEKENIGVNSRKDELNISAENADILENNENYFKSDNDRVNEISENTEEESQNLQNFKESLTKELTENNMVLEESITQNMDIYSSENSCKVCLDSKGDLCKGLEPSENLRSLNFLQCIINILENEISKSKRNLKDYYIMKQDNYEHQTRKRKVNEKKTDVSNNNLDTAASEGIEVQDMEMNPKNLTPSSMNINSHTNSKMRAKLSHMTHEKNVEEVNVDNRISEMKIRSQSGVKSQTQGTDEGVDKKSLKKSIDSSGEKKNRNNQRYSSEDLYKPRIQLRRSGRDSKNP